MLRLAICASLVMCSPMLLFAQGITRIVDDDGAGTVASCDASGAVTTTVGAAIAASASGDTVLVCPGAYVENINFSGKAIVVRSVGGPAVTMLNGDALDSVVTFESGETRASVLEGFTITNGTARNPLLFGGGILIDSASPVIRGNIVVANRACSGFGIGLYRASPLIEGNTISGNSQGGCTGGSGGAGIGIIGDSTAIIRRNVITNNNGTSVEGGGISMFSAGSPTVENNRIAYNTSLRGGGISMVSISDANITGNLIVGNTAQSRGGGIHWLVPSGARGPLVVNNTIAGNSSPSGSGIFADGFDADATLINNQIIAVPGQPAVSCGPVSPETPTFRSNNVFSVFGAAYAGDCASRTGQNGNTSADPRFANAASDDYHLLPDSPGIDAGLNDAALVISTDLDGAPRLLDGNRDGVAVVDIGAYEARSQFFRHVQMDGPVPGDVGSSLVVSGWAVDGRSPNSGVDTVHVWAHPEDGSAPTFLGVAEYGLPRPDVAAALDDLGYVNSGFSLTVTRSLRAGAYVLVAYARSTLTGTFDTTGQVRVTVRSAPYMAIDSPQQGETIRGSLRLNGWALDHASLEGTGVDAIHVYAYPAGGASPVFLGVATYGLPRTDVGVAFGAQRFAASGWQLEATLPAGSYQVAVYARSDIAQAFNQVAVRAVTVIGSAPRVWIDTPVPNASMAQPFTIAGWAIDLGAATGPGVDAVHVYAYPDPGSGQPPVFLGVATYGTPRPDVAVAFGSTQFTNSGYSITASGLPAGRYLVAVHSHSTVTNSFNAFHTVTIDVTR